MTNNARLSQQKQTRFEGISVNSSENQTRAGLQSTVGIDAIFKFEEGVASFSTTSIRVKLL